MAEYKLPFTGKEIEEKLTFDSTLTKAGSAADAKAVGDAIANIDMSAYATTKELSYAASAVSNEFLKLFNETFIPGENVGETLTWDGVIDGREYYETETGDGSMQGVSRWVHVSDSVPTLEQLSAGCRWGQYSNLSGEFQEHETIFNSEIFDITEDNNCINISYKDPWAGLFSPVPHIVKTAYVDGAGIVYAQPGVYFMAMDTNFIGSVRNTFFTIPGYNFKTSDRVLKVFKNENMPVEVQELVNKVDATADIYLAMPSTVEGLGGIHTLDEAVSATVGAPVTSNVYVVKSLPAQLRPSLDNANDYVMNIYIIDSTGIGYVFISGVVMSLSDVLEGSLGQEEFTGAYNKGWVKDISSVDPETSPGVYCVRSHELFETIPGKTVNVSDTITWDGDLDNFDGVVLHGSNELGEIFEVKVSDSIPTVEEIGSETEFSYVYKTPDETKDLTSSVISIGQAEEGMIDLRSDGFIHVKIVSSTSAVSSTGQSYPETGVYLTGFKMSSGISLINTSLTIPGYNFIVQEPGKKVIKPDLIPVDTTLTKEGAPADAKAVGDRLAAIGNGGGASGGLSIKKIEFTDRPSAWEWFKSNYAKAIKATLSASLIGGAVISYNNVNARFSSGGDSVTSVYLTSIYPYIIDDAQVDYSNILLKLTDIDTSVIMGTNNIVFTDTPTINIEGTMPQTLPDIYWTQLSAKLTVYYVD